MISSHALRIGLAAALMVLPAANGEDAPLPDRIQFSRDIRPILSENCFKCHGPDPKARQAGLRLDTREGALSPLDEGHVAVAPGNLAKSHVWKRISSTDRDERMPPAKSGKKLSAREIAMLKKWIEQGAEYQGHWAFIPPQRPVPPAVKNGAGVRNPIDAFILSRLEREGLKPSPEADKITLIRRLSFDLLGLPPSPEEVDAFLADSSPAAYEKVVDRLLASPHYGERMTLYWLDLVRFADSRGYHSDNPRNTGAFRDYVITAFNQNTPFDKFTLEQLAGDLIPESTLRQRVASGYNKLNLTTEEGGAQPREYEAKTAADRVRNASGVWMGATLGCAECHDHKFDPFTTRDFYRFAAFFADIKEGAIGDGDKGILVPDDAQSAEIRKFETSIAALKKKIDSPSPDVLAAQAGWEKTALTLPPWRVLVPQSVKAAGGVDVFVEEDGSVILTGANPAKDTHTVTTSTALQGITGFRLEALTWPTLRSNGPGRADNGNFVLTQFAVKTNAKAVTLQKATADHSQDAFGIATAIDGKKQSGWAVLPQIGTEHVAVFETKEALAGGPLTVTLEYQSPHAAHVIGRFRISVTTSSTPAAGTSVSNAVRAILKTPPEQRTDAQKKELTAYYLTVAPAMEPVRKELADTEKRKDEFEKTIRRSLVSMMSSPRTVRILPRGNWLDSSGEVVTPGVPAFMKGLEIGERRATRLDLAQWLVSKENPLTSRVFVNRLWRLFLGTGFSKRLDDLGAQGEWPVHAELLDWLAVEFRDAGWDVKKTVKLLMMSATYRQSSKPSKEIKERDPYNRLHACQTRFRLDAEMVRDNALAVSGLLSRKIGGESVKPYQPRGYWSFLNFPTREWQNDAGENAWRRGLYTWWQRTFPHPSLLAFDAPSREECCAERTKSNIPQQALALLNDPTYVEAARIFAEKVVREGGATPSDRLTWAFRRAVSRRPTPAESKLLLELHQKHLAQFKADPKAAEQVTKVGQAPASQGDAAELAAWTSITRALLNLHETITRE